MPRVTVDGFGIIGVVDDGETVAGKAVPLGGGGRGARGSRAGVDDLEIDGEIAWESLGVTFGVDEEAAVEAPNIKVSAPKGTGLKFGELGKCPSAEGRVVAPPLNGY